MHHVLHVLDAPGKPIQQKLGVCGYALARGFPVPDKYPRLRYVALKHFMGWD